MSGFFFLIFPSQSFTKLYPLYLPIKVQISLLYQKLSLNKFKPVLKGKQVDNNNLKIFVKDQNSQRKTNFFGILKIRGGILLYSKNFFPV